jgi:DHA3 family macrolide efflux protein-like MFS transporter
VGGAILALWGGFKKRIYTSLMGIIMLGVGLLALGLVPGTLFIGAVLLVFFMGVTAPIIDGPIMAIIQGNVAPEMQGRVFTLLTSLVSLATPIGLILAGPISDLLSLQFWFLLSGVICILVGTIYFFVPSVANIDQEKSSPAAQKNVLGAEKDPQY